VGEGGRLTLKWLGTTPFLEALERLEVRRLFSYKLLSLDERQNSDDAYNRTKAYWLWLPLVINRKIHGEMWEGVSPNLTTREYMEVLTGERPPPPPQRIYRYSL